MCKCSKEGVSRGEQLRRLRVSLWWSCRWLNAVNELNYSSVVRSHEGLGSYWDKTDASLDNWQWNSNSPSIHLSGWYGTCECECECECECALEVDKLPDSPLWLYLSSRVQISSMSRPWKRTWASPLLVAPHRRRTS